MTQSEPQDDKGPWGGSGNNDGAGGGGGTPPEPPRSPWLPQDDEAPRAQRRGRSLDEALRRGKSPFGPQFPQLPGGRSLWGWAIAALLGLWIIGTSFWQVGPDQEGVVTRFGSYSRTVGPGISFTLPAPFERMQRISVREIRTEDIPGGTGENLVLTGDANIIDLSYSVRWSIKEPERFLFQLEDPEATIRASAESAMRASVANFTLAQAIGQGRTQIGVQVQQRMQQILDSYRSGVRIEGVAIRDSRPPEPVREAFDNVNASRQRAEANRNQARAYAESVVRRAEGDAGEFDAVYAEYRQAPAVTRRRIYYETMERILRNADKTIVESGGVTPYLPLPEVRRGARPTVAPAAGGGAERPRNAPDAQPNGGAAR